MDLACFLIFFPSLSDVRTIVTCNKRKDATTSFDPLSFSVFRSASPHRSVFFLVASPSSLFQAADFDVRASGLWSADSAVL